MVRVPSGACRARVLSSLLRADDGLLAASSTSLAPTLASWLVACPVLCRVPTAARCLSANRVLPARCDGLDDGCTSPLCPWTKAQPLTPRCYIFDFLLLLFFAISLCSRPRLSRTRRRRARSRSESGSTSRTRSVCAVAAPRTTSRSRSAQTVGTRRPACATVRPAKPTSKPKKNKKRKKKII